MNLHFAPRRETIGRTLVGAARAALSFLLSSARLFGGYAPFAVGMVGGAGPGWQGLAALVGAASGALVFLDFPHALRATACCVLLFSANNAFCEVRRYKSPWFLPVLTAALTAAVELIYLLRSGTASDVVSCVLAIALSAAFAPCARVALGGREERQAHPGASLMLLLGILSALSIPELRGGLAPGRIAAVLALLVLVFRQERAAALIAAISIGLCLDCTASGTPLFLHTACFGFTALLTSLLHRGSRVRAAMIFPLSAALFTLPLERMEGYVLLYECLAGTLLFLLTPTQLLRRAQEDAPEPDDGLRRRLREAAAGLQELYDSVVRTEPVPEENPAVVYDRAAEAVCRDCALRERCWVNEYNRTYTALSDATLSLLRNGEGRGADFPAYFTDRCIRFPSFLSAVNTELRAYLLRLQYRRRLDEAHAQAAGQYARFSALLTQAAERGAADVSATIPYRVGLTLRPKGGEAVSGDSASTFETEAGQLCLLLSDGMGSGTAAQRESAMAVRLIERFLRAGVDAQPALQTLNSAMNLRAETSDSFTTIDLVTLSLKNGEGALYKYGAAPTYLKRGERVHRVSCSCLPAGLAAEEPEMTHLRLEGGSFLVMVTDGVADATDDGWLQELLSAWEGTEPQQLVAAILAESFQHKGTEDDAGVLALYLPESAPREV